MFGRKTKEDVEWDLNIKAIDVLKYGRVKKFNRWRLRYPDWQPNLSGSDLNGAFIPEVNLACAGLSATRFRRADLQRARLDSTQGAGADFQGALLDGCSLTHAKFNGANFSGLNISNYADFSNAHLEGADFSGTHLFRVNFCNASLRNANFKNAWINQCNFSGASLQGADLRGTVYLYTNIFAGATVDSDKVVEDILQALRTTILVEEFVHR